MTLISPACSRNEFRASGIWGCGAPSSFDNANDKRAAHNGAGGRWYMKK